MFGAYQPALPRDLVHRLWLLKQATGRPMTNLLREAVEAYLAERIPTEPKGAA